MDRNDPVWAAARAYAEKVRKERAENNIFVPRKIKERKSKVVKDNIKKEEDI